MSIGYPPTPVYPIGIDSDATLFEVYNTSESALAANNPAWADTIQIVPVDAADDEIWGENGFANICGELFYYNKVDKDDNGKIYRFKECARNLGGKKTKANQIGTMVRGFVIAEHHNQLADTALLIENFVGENFSENEVTLDWRIRHLAIEPDLLDDNNCPTVNFTFTITSQSSSQGTVVNYEADITGTFNNFQIDFGDGNTTSDTTGTYTYAPNALVDPILTVSNDQCQVVQSPTQRTNSQTPAQATTETSFEIPIPAIDFPTINTPSISLPDTTLTLPPIVFPCLDIGPIGGFSIPSLIMIQSPNIPSLIEITPISIPSTITLNSINIPSTISITGPVFPSTITFNSPNIPSIISVEAPKFPTMISINSPHIPSIISIHGGAKLPSVISVDSKHIPSIISISGKIPSVISLDGKVPSLISLHGKIPSVISLHGKVPSIISLHGKVPSVISIHGKVPSLISLHGKIPSSIEIKGKVPSTIKLEGNIASVISLNAKLPSVISLHGSIPSLISLRGSIPSVISLRGSIPSLISLHGSIPSIISVKSSLPHVISLHGHLASEISVHGLSDINVKGLSDISIMGADSIPSTITIDGTSIPQLTVNWGTPPPISGTVTVTCGGTSMMAVNSRSASLQNKRLYNEEFVDEFDSEIPEIKGKLDFVIPSEIKITVPEFPELKLRHDIPLSIELISPNIPTKIEMIGPKIPIPTQIEIIAHIPSVIKLDSSNLPEKIEIDASKIPASIMLEVPTSFPTAIKIDASDIPREIKVTGIPDHIELKGSIPSEIIIKAPGKMEIDLVYKGGPIPMQPVQVQMDMKSLVGEDGKDMPCFALVPCKR